jgi:protease I
MGSCSIPDPAGSVIRNFRAAELFWLEQMQEHSMTNIKKSKVAILSTNGFEQSELFQPKEALEAAGATVHVVSPEAGSIKGWKDGDWGDSVKVDVLLKDARMEDYDALVLPGGQMNPDVLRTIPEAVAFAKSFFDAGKPLAAICHAPWLLVEAGIVSGLSLTSYKSIKTDIVNAGGKWTDKAVVADKGVITSRDPGDLEAFSDKIIEQIGKSRDVHSAV